MSGKKICWFGGLIAACLILTGCSSPVPKVFSEQEDASDTLPSYVEIGFSAFETRHIVDHDGWSIYLVKKAPTLCMVVVASDEDPQAWGITCSDSGAPVELVVPDAPRFLLSLQDPAKVNDAVVWIPLGSGVYVRA